MRYSEIIGALQADLRQVYQDKKIEPYTILYWVTIVANKLLYQHLQKGGRSLFSGEYLKEFSIDIKNDGVRKYFDLPLNVLNLGGRDGGINYVSYSLNDEFGDDPDIGMMQFTCVSTQEIPRLYLTSAEKPTPKNPYFYRVGAKAYLLGIEKVPCSRIFTGLVLGSSAIEINSIDDEISLPDHLLSILHYEILKLGQFALMIPDGEDSQKLKQLSQAKVETNEE